MRRRAALVPAILLLAGGLVYWLHPVPNTCLLDSTCTRVLFRGNSYTYVNDLPADFRQLAWSGGHRVETGLQAESGWTLQQHAEASSTASLIGGSKWGYVVLQEQSQLPASAGARQASMYPAARTLAKEIGDDGARAVLFETWGRRDGWPEAGLSGYEGMQDAIEQGYGEIGDELGVSVAPVGGAWLRLVNQGDADKLWQSDGSHPTSMGTYLAVCVFYAVLFGQSPIGLSFRGDLSASDASAAQQAAVDTVLGSLAIVGLPGGRRSLW
jgi:hypothetical protein